MIRSRWLPSILPTISDPVFHHKVKWRDSITIMSFGCSICQDPFGDSDSSVTNCGHIYHHRCILDWINRNRSCPSCRTSCAPSHLKRLYFSSVHDDKPLRLDYEYDYDRYFGECAEEALKSYNEDLNRENRKLQSQLKMLENNKNQKIKWVH